GAERHDSRRIDNQLRGRAGRQGDPGSSRFYVSLDDDLMRIFGGDKIAGIMTALKIPEEEAIEHQMVSRALEQAQIKVEGFHFDMRKRVVDYDDVMNNHRAVIYKLRDRILEEAESKADSLRTRITDLIASEITLLVNSRIVEGISSKELDAIVKEFITIIPFDDNSQKKLLIELAKAKNPSTIISALQEIATVTYTNRVKEIGETTVSEIERYVYLSTIDEKWMDHLDNMESLRDGIGLRGYAQRDPLVEYQKEAYGMFGKLVSLVESGVVKKIYRLTPVVQTRPQPIVLRKDEVTPQGEIASPAATTTPPNAIPVSSSEKIGRNDQCPCGSGLKYKKCHGKAV
ncbi:MAG: SEC-C metal-binding domain-containing protein, partial [bacterium]